MYSPTQGRFITRDPIGFDAGDPNFYRFEGNNPPNRLDPSGLQAVVSPGGVIVRPAPPVTFPPLSGSGTARGGGSGTGTRLAPQGFRYPLDLSPAERERANKLIGGIYYNDRGEAALDYNKYPFIPPVVPRRFFPEDIIPGPYCVDSPENFARQSLYKSLTQGTSLDPRAVRIYLDVSKPLKYAGVAKRERDCDAEYNSDVQICDQTYTGEAYKECLKRAAMRYARCLAGDDPRPPLIPQPRK